MTIHFINQSTNGAVLGGLNCPPCNEIAAEERRKSRPRQSISQAKESLSRFVPKERDPFDVLHSMETDAENIVRTAERHHELHDDHEITVWFFDIDHPLTDDEVARLEKAGVEHAAAYGVHE